MTILRTVLAAVIFFAAGGLARAAIARYHYVPGGPHGALTFAPTDPTAGQRISVFGTRPDGQPPPPTVMMTYRHPCSGKPVVVPLAMPHGTPTIYHRGNRVMYNYSGYTIQVEFLPDGSVDVIYNSGLFRAL